MWCGEWYLSALTILIKLKNYEMIEIPKAKLLLIGGASCSGKSSIANTIAKVMKGVRVTVCSIDDYYRDLCLNEGEDISDHNFDDPETVDAESLIDDVEMLLNGFAVHTPIYDYGLHGRVGFRIVGPCDLLIVEGLFALYYPELVALADLCVFVDCCEDKRLYRRLARDIEQRGQSRESVLKQYKLNVEPMYEKVISNTRLCASMILDGERSVLDNVNELKEVLIRDLKFHEV